MADVAEPAAAIQAAVATPIHSNGNRAGYSRFSDLVVSAVAPDAPRR